MSFATKLSVSSILALVSHKATQRKIALFTMALLVVYIAFLAAKITWFVVPNTQGASQQSMIHAIGTTKNEGNNTFDLTKLQALNLFGLYSDKVVKEDVVQVESAPQTRLQLTLSGLVASSVPGTAAAIIENKGKQETYGIGDIIIGTRASLEKVLMDRVLIKQSGRLETLMLDGFDFKEPAIAIKQDKAAKKSNRTNQATRQKKEPDVIDQRRNKQLSRTVKNLRENLSENPANITDYLSISPKRKEGNIIGYSLRPGKDPEFFKLSGLKRGDLAVQMNGYDLVIPSEAAKALSTMKEARDISLLIERDSSLMEILFSIE